MAICRVSEKINAAHLRNTLRALDFFASVHLTVLERLQFLIFSTVS